MKTITLCLLAALAAASSYFEGDVEGVQDDDDGIVTLHSLFNVLIFGIMLAIHLLRRQITSQVERTTILRSSFR
jgi:hypothetical protein